MAASTKEAPQLTLQHPDLKPSVAPRAMGKKQRRTTVRTAKLVNMSATEELGPIQISQVPIEPSHNNHGVLDDPSMPLRHYLNKGFRFPHEVVGDLIEAGHPFPEGKPVPTDFVYCALLDCWERATLSDSEVGTERCAEHEEMWRAGHVRYATRSSRPR